MPSRPHSSAMLSQRRPSSTILIFSSAPYCLLVPRRMSFSAACADGFEFFGFIFDTYSHYNEPKTLSYFMQPVCLMNSDWGTSGNHSKSGSVIVAVSHSSRPCPDTCGKIRAAANVASVCEPLEEKASAVGMGCLMMSMALWKHAGTRSSVVPKWW